MRLHLLVGLVVIGGAAAVAACGGETDTTYGPPGEWVGRPPPSPGQGVSGSSGGSGSSTSSSSGGSSSSSGGSGSSSGGSGSGSSSGGSGGDGGTGSSSGGSGSSSGGTSTCSVSWSTQVFTALQNDGQCGSSTACHASGGQLPTFLNNNPNGTYNQFTQYTQLENKPYVKTGDTNPNDSTIDCSLNTQTCQTLNAMPTSPPANWTANDKALVDTWVKCGAPNN